MIQTLDTFNNDSLDPKGLYIIAMNYYSKPGVTLGQDSTGELAPTADTFESGISEDAFYSVMEDFAAQHDQEVIYEDDEVVIMTANEALYHAIHEECGERFTYDIGGQKWCSLIFHMNSVSAPKWKKTAMLRKKTIHLMRRIWIHNDPS